ncbi:MAG TPA: MFS transporter [Trebonia sp.]|jgi:EmrB/QacA subfamily drug resistance transporter|nr:MFS transporter [Trebonia sp.]
MAQASPAQGEPVTRQATQRRHAPDGAVLALACVAQFMVVLDVSIVNVALPSVGRDLHYSASGLQWVVNAYVLTFAGLLLFGGRAADLFGRRRAYLFGLGLFTLASLAGGLAQDSAWLTAARAAQGVGGAFLSPASLTIIVTTFSGQQRRTRAIGAWSAVAGAGGAAGAILGGVLTAELSWRWVLFVNLPIGIIAGAVAAVYLTELRRPAAARPRLDVGGAVTITAGLGVLVYAIIETSTHAWLSAGTLVPLAVAVVLLAAFAVIEHRLAAAPLVPFGLLRSRSVAGANLVMLPVGAAFFSMWYFLSLYFQDVLGYSALRAGLAFIPMAVAIIVGAQASPRLLPKVGLRPLLAAAMLLAAGGFGWLAQVPAHSSYLAHILGPGCVIALALGLLFTPLASAATSGVPVSQAGLASGMLNTSRQVGGSIGLAALATVAVDRTREYLATGHGTASALTAGYDRAFIIAAILSLAGLICSLLIHTPTAPPAAPDQQSQPVEQPERR